MSTYLWCDQVKGNKNQMHSISYFQLTKRFIGLSLLSLMLEFDLPSWYLVTYCCQSQTFKIEFEASRVCSLKEVSIKPWITKMLAVTLTNKIGMRMACEKLIKDNVSKTALEKHKATSSTYVEIGLLQCIWWCWVKGSILGWGYQERHKAWSSSYNNLTFLYKNINLWIDSGQSCERQVPYFINLLPLSPNLSFLIKVCHTTF